MQKLLKCAGNNDIITLKADDSAEMLTLMYEDPKADRVSGKHCRLRGSQR
jgi:proliferating cell nuclear antigen